MRYAVSGSATIVDEASGAGNHLFAKSITSGRSLWLKSLWMHQAYDLSGIRVALVDVSADATYAATDVRATLGTFSATSSGRVMNQIDFPGPGVKFVKGCRIIATQTLVATIGAGVCGGCGYEE
jgi:hypothetical protein